MKIRIYTAIEKGLRERQEDALCYESTCNATLATLAVADGLGGHPRGDEASAAAVRTVQALANPVLLGKVTVRDLMQRADEAVTALSWVKPEQRKPDYRNGPGSTLTAAFVNGPLVTIGHIGDSRAYVFRKGALRQITRDHGYGGHVVSRALGNWDIPRDAENDKWDRGPGGERSPYDVCSLGVEPGDVLLLCTDGVHGVLRDSVITGMLRDEADAADLVKAALDARSRDNCTVIVAHFEA